MIKLTPDAYSFPHCAFCEAPKPKTGALAFGGHHLCVEVTCDACQRHYLADLPVGHALYTPGAVCLKSFELKSHPDALWFSRSLVAGAKAYAQRRQASLSDSAPRFPVEVVRLKPAKDVVVVSCIDFLYGHVLLKLLNVQAYFEQAPELGVVVVVPRSFCWLVPDGVAEIWLVDVPLSQGDQWLDSLCELAPGQLARFDNAWLSLSYGSHVPSQIDISRFTRVKPFQLEQFRDSPLHVTVVAREDRLWFGSPLAQFWFKVLKRLITKRLATGLFVRLQDARILALIRALRRVNPSVQVTIVGIGNAMSQGDAEDQRTRKITDEVERRWCQAYARSHVVVGIHGSNMLLPTAHAAGVVEMLPDDRQGNILQDILSPWEGRRASFLVRFTGEFPCVREVAAHILGIYHDYDVHCLQMDTEMLTHGAVTDVSAWQKAYTRAVYFAKRGA